MAQVVPIRNGFDSPKALLASLADKADDIEWITVSYQTKDGRFSDYTNNMTLGEMAVMALGWLGIFQRIDEG